MANTQKNTYQIYCMLTRDSGENVEFKPLQFGNSFSIGDEISIKDVDLGTIVEICHEHNGIKSLPTKVYVDALDPYKNGEQHIKEYLEYISPLKKFIKNMRVDEE